jgi:hypothetical protein
MPLNRNSCSFTDANSAVAFTRLSGVISAPVENIRLVELFVNFGYYHTPDAQAEPGIYEVEE